MATGACERYQLLLTTRFPNDRPVGLNCSLRSGRGAFGLKSAVVEAFAHFSPGLQLEIESIRRFHDNGGPQWVDSCAAFDSVLFNRLYLERRILQSLLVSSGRVPGDLVVSSLPLLRWAKRLYSRPGRNRT